MRIVTWNVNSVRMRLTHLLGWLDKHRPDVLCLQETKIPDEGFPRMEIESMGYAIETHGQKAYNGVAIISRLPMENVVRGFGDLDDVQKRVIAATVGGIRIMSMYVPNGQSTQSAKYVAKLEWLDHFLRILSERHRPDEPLLLCGDFNIAPEDRDVHDPKRWRGKILCSEPERAKFRAFLGWGLHDAVRVKTEEGGFYTWWDYRLSGFRRNWGLRLDHFLISLPLTGRVHEIWVDREVRGMDRPSDHAPVVLELDSGSP
jgi:exodeoxyribonuclease III